MDLKAFCAVAALVLPALATQAAEPAAKVVLVTGVATVGTRALSAGDQVAAGDTVVTGANSYANLRFADGGRVLLRPDTEFTVEQFRYVPEASAPAPAPAPAPATATPGAPAAEAPPEQTAFFRLVRGGFRAISGLIGAGDRRSYRVTTPTATIGIRGTDYEAQLCAGDCPDTGATVQHDPVLVAAGDLSGLQLAQAGGVAASGLVVATNEGSVVLQTPRGEFTINAGQVAMAMANGQVFQLPTVPDLMLMHPTPSPDTCR